MYRIGVDVGGTFTDLVAVDDAGRAVLEKVPSTPDDPSQGVPPPQSALRAATAGRCSDCAPE
jgi:N-methylhydantoinase A